MNTNNLDTDELFRLVIADNKRAFDMFFHLYYQQVFRFAYYQLKDTNACKEVISNVFYSVWKSRKSLGEIKTIEAYLYVVTKNEAQRYLAHNNRCDNISIDDLPIQLEINNDENPEDQVIGKELEELIDQIIGQLPDKCRCIFLLSRSEGLSNKDIAERLSISESTVRVQMKIAIEKLTAQISTHYPHLRFIFVCSLLLNS